jgi:uncharacterized protein with von Willebrand factor type A (vWA) domain
VINMPGADAPEFFVWTLFQQLRRRDFALGPNEYELFRQALRAGFGWSSRQDLREVCAALWAKSPEERAVVAALLDQLVPLDWTLEASELSRPDGPPADAGATAAAAGAPQEIESPSLLARPAVEEIPIAPVTAATGRLPPLALSEMPTLPHEHIFLPQYPVNFRNAAQAWRRLRWPVREGPATELDVDATIARRSRVGTVSPAVLRPRRRNRVRLLLLVDRQGSMTPFHDYVDEVCQAINQAGRLGHVAAFYFRNMPLKGTDPAILDRLTEGMFARLDPIMADIPPLTTGRLYADRQLVDAVPAAEVLSEHAQGAATVIISDGGAARGRYQLVRLLDTVAFLRGLKSFTTRIVWLNPLPASAWQPSSAAEIARHVPMFAMDQDGMHRAVNVLRGQPVTVEKPIAAGQPHAAVLPEARAAAA